MDEKLDFDVSTVANDTYFFYIELGKKCRTELEKSEKSMKDVELEISRHEAALVELKKAKSATATQIDLLRNKNVDINNIIAELEKNKRQFKAIVTGAQSK